MGELAPEVSDLGMEALLESRHAAFTHVAKQVATSAPEPGSPLPTSAPGLSSPLPASAHLRHDSPESHLHGDWAQPVHICTATGLAEVAKTSSRVYHTAHRPMRRNGAGRRQACAQVVAWLEAEDELASELERRLRGAAEALDVLRSQVRVRPCVSASDKHHA